MVSDSIIVRPDPTIDPEPFSDEEAGYTSLWRQWKLGLLDDSVGGLVSLWSTHSVPDRKSSRVPENPAGSIALFCLFVERGRVAGTLVSPQLCPARVVGDDDSSEKCTVNTGAYHDRSSRSALDSCGIDHWSLSRVSSPHRTFPSVFAERAGGGSIPF